MFPLFHHYNIHTFVCIEHQLYPARTVLNMKIARTVFESLVSNDGLDISFSLYHECLHSIAYTHAKVLSIPQNKFINPVSPMN